MKRSRKLPEDANQRATETAGFSTKEPQDQSQPVSVDLPVSEYLAKTRRKGGLTGGKARAKKVPAKKRK